MEYEWHLDSLQCSIAYNIRVFRRCTIISGNMWTVVGRVSTQEKCHKKRTRTGGCKHQKFCSHTATDGACYNGFYIPLHLSRAQIHWTLRGRSNLGSLGGHLPFLLGYPAGPFNGLIFGNHQGTNECVFGIRNPGRSWGIFVWQSAGSQNYYDFVETRGDCVAAIVLVSAKILLNLITR